MRSLYATVNKSILVASEYPYMRTRLLLLETAVYLYRMMENNVFMNIIENIMTEHHEHDIGEHQGHEQDD